MNTPKIPLKNTSKETKSIEQILSDKSNYIQMQITQKRLHTGQHAKPCLLIIYEWALLKAQINQTSSSRIKAEIYPQLSSHHKNLKDFTQNDLQNNRAKMS